MKIKFVEIQNFRKLKSCRIDFSEKETIFVGANNSGKTSAMDALIYFLKDKSKFSTQDFTLSNWEEINKIGKNWISNSDDPEIDLTIDPWQDYLPQLDIWIEVEKDELQFVSRLIPTLDWDGGLLGVRVRFEPDDIKRLFQEFTSSYKSSHKLKASSNKKLKLWPCSMWDYLERRLRSSFTCRAYILDPEKLEGTKNGEAQSQKISPDSFAIQGNPFEGLIKVDVINAQRGFSDPNDSFKNVGSLSSQLREYFSRHLNPLDQPAISDLDALQAIEEAKKQFDQTLTQNFESSLSELEELNYPGFGNPQISLSSAIRPIDGLNHESAVQFSLLKTDKDNSERPLKLSEIYNGLGYQNLISMVFKLIRFRDEWMKVGKKEKKEIEEGKELIYEPLHLVLVEEPEAHLHAQVQQVFIEKAHGVLRNHKRLKEKKQFSTQLVVSTHSNHIAHKIDFISLRYFKRLQAKTPTEVPTSIVVNLSETFGEEDDTTKFAIRYLRTTHCDLFFADAVILVEGPAERMLIPHFIRKQYQLLASSYISLVEIGGSHAHRLRPLIEKLGVLTLIIGDLDSAKGQTAVQPQRGKNYVTGNSTLKKWLPGKDKVDELLGLSEDHKESKNGKVRIAFQTPILIKLNKDKDGTEEAIPYTFEDALAFQNIDLFKKLDGTGLIRKFRQALNKKHLPTISKDLFNALKKGKKAEFALELLFLQEPDELTIPDYIANGLDWLQDKLQAPSTT